MYNKSHTAPGDVVLVTIVLPTTLSVSFIIGIIIVIICCKNHKRRQQSQGVVCHDSRMVSKHGIIDTKMKTKGLIQNNNNNKDELQIVSINETNTNKEAMPIKVEATDMGEIEGKIENINDNGNDNDKNEDELERMYDNKNNDESINETNNEKTQIANESNYNAKKEGEINITENMDLFQFLEKFELQTYYNQFKQLKLDIEIIKNTEQNDLQLIDHILFFF